MAMAGVLAIRLRPIFIMEEMKCRRPTGKAQWSREAIHKLLSNEKYTGRVLFQKTIRTGRVQVKNEGEEWQYLYENAHAAIISDELFWSVQKVKASRAKIVS